MSAAFLAGYARIEAIATALQATPVEDVVAHIESWHAGAPGFDDTRVLSEARARAGRAEAMARAALDFKRAIARITGRGEEKPMWKPPPPSPNPMWKRPIEDLHAEVGRRVDEHRRDRARRERQKLLASRALAIGLLFWCVAGLAVNSQRPGPALVLAGLGSAIALLAGCIRVAAALPREPRGQVVPGPGRRRGGAA